MKITKERDFLKIKVFSPEASKGSKRGTIRATELFLVHLTKTIMNYNTNGETEPDLEFYH